MAEPPGPANRIGNPVNALASTIDPLAAPLDYILNQRNEFVKIFHTSIVSDLSAVAEVARPIMTNLGLAAGQVLYELRVAGTAIWQVVTDLAFPAIDLASRKKDVMVAYLKNTHLDMTPVIQIASNSLALVRETFALGLQAANHGIDAVRFILKMVSSLMGAVDRIRDLNLSACLVILLITLWLAREILGRARD